MMDEIKTIIRKDGKPYTVRSSRSDIFFPDEWTSFIKALYGERAKFTFNLLINTGCRHDEAANIRVEDIFYDRYLIIVRHTKRKALRQRQEDGTFINVPNPNPRKPRTIPISKEFAEVLRKTIKKYELAPTLGILRCSQANLAMKNALQSMGLPRWQMFSVHNVRKTSENWLKALGVPDSELYQRFGHTSEVARQHYLNSNIFRPEHKEKIRRILGDVYL
jgi:integrase